jgi:methylenetetrahydrofolate reductase (NADPH)
MSESGVQDVPGALRADFSLDLPWKDAGPLELLREVMPPTTRIHLGFTDSEDVATRVGAARAIRQAGFEPVPIIPARRLESESMLREYLAGLRAAGASGSVLVVAGDPEQPRGPYPDAISVISSGALEEYGVRSVSVAGHPAGHPLIPDDALWQALAGKAAELRKRRLAGSVITQFGFDAHLVLGWLAGLRARGVSLPVRVGVPGPAAARRLLWYASRCDVSVSAAVAREYGFSLTDPAGPDPVGTVGPDRFLRALESGYDPRQHGEVKLHLFTFGRPPATAEWIRDFGRRSPGSSNMQLADHSA